MPEVENPVVAEPKARLNVADRLAAVAREMPQSIAVACPRRWSRTYRSIRQGQSGTRYATTTFAELDADVTRIARGLMEWGVPPGTRLALLVRPGIEFVTLVFALLRAGMVVVLVDPGLGKRNLVRCLAESEPEGFVAIGLAQAGRLWLRRKFPRARWNVTVGRRWFWGGLTLDQLRARGNAVGWAPPTDKLGSQMVGGAHPTMADNPAAIIFTSGSTGPPKGVLYTQRMFDAQVAEIQSMYGIELGGVDLACFPLFALFNSAMGVTTILPPMDFSRPASAEPGNLLTAANDWQVTQAFASPAVWRVLSAHCAKSGARIRSLQQVFSCGAPVPADVLRATLACVGDAARMHTPYGMTECLPVSTIEAAEILGETATQTDQGAGVCVGRKFDSIEWRVIRITDEPIVSMDAVEELPTGEIGELIVRGPQVSPLYVTRPEANAFAKIDGVLGTTYSGRSAEGAASPFVAPWHRTGDVGYIDDAGRFWYCGRKSQRVESASGPLYTECVEGIINTHPAVRRCALVGIGPRHKQTPILVIESISSRHNVDLVRDIRPFAGAHEHTQGVEHVLVHDRLPVDIRHNAKINREQLSVWASDRLKTTT